MENDDDDIQDSDRRSAGVAGDDNYRERAIAELGDRQPGPVSIAISGSRLPQQRRADAGRTDGPRICARCGSRLWPAQSLCARLCHSPASRRSAKCRLVGRADSGKADADQSRRQPFRLTSLWPHLRTSPRLAIRSTSSSQRIRAPITPTSIACPRSSKTSLTSLTTLATLSERVLSFEKITA